MKNAKKSMFITTILMVAVLIVAISTATFAWYTASDEGSASQANLVAAESDAANVAVGWTNSANTTSITFSTTGAEVEPMAPTAVPTADMEYANLELKTATLDSFGAFNEDGGTATPWTVKDEAGTYSSFFVINYNVNAGTTVNMGIEYAANVADDPDTDGVDETKVYENNDKLVVAVFVDGKLAGVFTKLAKYAAGAIVEGDTASQLPTTDALITDNIAITLDAAPNSTTGSFKEITVKAWLDGAALTQDYAAGLAAFSFTFGV